MFHIKADNPKGLDWDVVTDYPETARAAINNIKHLGGVNITLNGIAL